jgi:hypothetical protein
MNLKAYGLPILIKTKAWTDNARPGSRVSSLISEQYTRLFESGVAMVVVAYAAVSLDGIIFKYNLASLIICRDGE